MQSTIAGAWFVSQTQRCVKCGGTPDWGSTVPWFFAIGETFACGYVRRQNMQSHECSPEHRNGILERVPLLHCWFGGVVCSSDLFAVRLSPVTGILDQWSPTTCPRPSLFTQVSVKRYAPPRSFSRHFAIAVHLPVTTAVSPYTLIFSSSLTTEEIIKSGVW